MMGFTHRDSIVSTFREDTSQALSGQAPFEEVIVKLRLKKKNFILTGKRVEKKRGLIFNLLTLGYLCTTSDLSLIWWDWLLNNLHFPIH